MVVGTSHGYIALLDLRFHIIVQLSLHSSNCPITKLKCLPHTYYDIADNVPLSSLPYIVVSSGNNEIGIWNIETGDLHQV